MSTWRAKIRPGLAIFGIWTAYGLFSVYQSYLFSRYVTGAPRPWGMMFKASLAAMWIWAGFTPVIVWLSRRFRVTRQTWWMSLPAHAVSCLTISAVDVTIDYWIAPVVGWPPRSRPFVSTWLIQFDGNFFAYLIVAAITHAVDYQRQYLERRRSAAQLELRAVQLESQLNRAQLDALRMQLHPHFLFNALHALSELIHEDPGNADHMVTRLGDLLRMSLAGAGRQEVPLSEEMNFIVAYLEIERCRHADRLQVRLAIEPEAMEAMVPNLILQPLVENAIRHGVARRLEGCRVAIAATRMNGTLQIDIEDDGPGLPADPGRIVEGVGLRNTRARLQALYGDAQTLQLSNRAGGGATVRLVLPYRVAADERELAARATES